MPSTQSELEDVSKLRHMASEFTEGFNTGDVDRIMRFYGDTYVDINLRNPVQSWQERREYYTQVIRNGGFRVYVDPDEILIRGDFAFIRAVQSNSRRPWRLVIPDARTFVTSKSPAGNRMVPGKLCGAWTAPSKNTHLLLDRMGRRPNCRSRSAQKQRPVATATGRRKLKVTVPRR